MLPSSDVLQKAPGVWAIISSMKVEGVGGFNFCTNALCIEPDADLSKRVSVMPEICKSPAIFARQEVMKRWIVIIIINVWTDHASLWDVVEDVNAAQLMLHAWIIASPGGKTQDRSVFPTNGVLLLLLLLRLQDLSETPGRSSSCLLATHDQVTQACGLKHSVGGVRQQVITEPVLFSTCI